MASREENARPSAAAIAIRQSEIEDGMETTEQGSSGGGRAREVVLALPETNYVLSVVYHPMPQLGRRYVLVDCNLPDMAEETATIADAFRRASLWVRGHGELSPSEQTWLADGLVGIYEDLIGTNRTSWDFRIAFGIPITRGRPITTERRDLFQAMDVALLQLAGSTIVRAQDQVVSEWRMNADTGLESVSKAWKRWGSAVRVVVEALIREDALTGVSTNQAIQDLRDGIQLSQIWRSPGCGPHGKKVI
ncbi:MAG: hypothetical protein JSR73_14145 [Proteobacteria bacterium]|nr:hypothetical protein [Pseudomonadota bacterium]